MKILVAECDNFSPEAVNLLTQAGHEVLLKDCAREELIESLQNDSSIEGLWVRLRNMIDTEVINTSSLRWILTATTGLTHLDTKKCQEENIQIISLKGEAAFLENIRATSELTLALTLSLLRKLPQAHLHATEGNWNRDLFRGREINGKTVGILGYGRLGKHAAKLFEAFGAHVITFDSNTKQMPQEIQCSREELFEQSDILSVHASYETQNYHLIGAYELSLMKASAVLINTARGELINEEALLKSLQDKKLAGAALDVLDKEQQLTPKERAQHPLVQYAATNDNLVLTPHIGGASLDSMQRAEIFLAQKFLDLQSENTV